MSEQEPDVPEPEPDPEPEAPDDNEDAGLGGRTPGEAAGGDD